MNYDPNNPDHSSEEPQPEESSPESESDGTKKRCSADSFEDFARNAREAIRSGMDDARESVERNFPKAKEEFAKGLHDVAYAVAYAGSFGVTLLKELTPENVRSGAKEGSEAGTKAASDFVQKQKESDDVSESMDDGDASPQMV